MPALRNNDILAVEVSTVYNRRIYNANNVTVKTSVQIALPAIQTTFCES